MSVIEELNDLRPGQSMIYHRGFLAMDRDHPTSSQSAFECDQIGMHAMKMCDDGYLVLYQRRIERGLYEYHAKRTQKR